MKNVISTKVSATVAQMDVLLNNRAKQLLLEDKILNDDFTLTHFRNMRDYIDTLNVKNSGFDNKVAELENKAEIALAALQQSARNLSYATL